MFSLILAFSFQCGTELMASQMRGTYSVTDPILSLTLPVCTQYFFPVPGTHAALGSLTFQQAVWTIHSAYPYFEDELGR